MNLLSRLRAHKATRYVGRMLAICGVILAVAIVSTLTIDLGPAVRRLAEREGSRRIERPVHIDRLAIHLLRGRVLVEGVTIDGVHAGDRPFFTAEQISVSLDWARALAVTPEFVITSVELTDWNMLVEKGANGHNFPKFSNDEPPGKPPGPRRFTTTTKYITASRGRFSYEDHEAPWSVVAPNIDLNIVNTPQYHGEASFSGGSVTIQQFVPMWANMQARFTIDGGHLRLDRIDLQTDGAKSEAVGELDLGHWPEQTYAVKSRIQFPRMREIFFATESWRLSGDGDFNGNFHLFKGGHDLSGKFTSELAGVDAYRFPALFGGLHWTRTGFEVSDAGSRLYGGEARFGFSIGPLGSPTPSTARFDATYKDVDVAQISDLYELRGVRFAGRATGRNLLAWPTGHFRERYGNGDVTIAPPAGIETMGPSLDSARSTLEPRPAAGAAVPSPLAEHLPIGGRVTYRFDPERVETSNGRFASERTHVAFDGATAWGGDSKFQFHVTSADWQESDQLLAGLLTDFGARTGPVAVAGRGEFNGGMTGPFRRPRVEGAFTGQDMRAWDTLWGDGSAHIVIENSYVAVNDGVIEHDGSEIRADGLFSLGYPRQDGGEEIDARFRVIGRDVDSLRHAFKIDDYPVSGSLNGEFHLTGGYEAPVGFGGMTVENGVAYGEPFEKGTAALRFDGTGVRLDNLVITKAGGTIEGAAFVGWNATYSFDATGRRIPMERTAAFAYPQAQPSGLIEFTAGGNGTFDQPRYDVRFRVNDLFVAEEGVGQVTGVLALRGQELSGEIDAASPRLNVTGTGRIGLSPQGSSDLTFRFHDSSLDPYVRLFVPKLSPFTTAVANGSIRVTGSLSDVDRLVVDATVDSIDMRLFDYAIRNAGPVRMALDQHVVRVEQLRLVGEGTQLDVAGTVQLHDQRIALRASGEANLQILQGFFRDVRGSGRAALVAAVDGPLYEPLFSGSATIADGRVRHFALPNSLDAINGTIQFDARGLRFDDLTAVMGGGRVQFGGRVGLDGYMPGELNVTVRGEGVRMRYPEGIRSTVDGDLSIRGNVKAPIVGGTVTVKDAIWSRRVNPTGGLFDFGADKGSGSRSGAAGGAVTTAAAVPAIPLRFDIEVHVPSTLRVENNLARLVASADLQLRGTYERPLLFGRAEVERGEVTFEARRYLVTHGAIEFTNPLKIEPFFDFEAETRVRVPGQTYRVIVRAAGTMERLQPELNSDPPLPAADVLALLFSDVRRNQVDAQGRPTVQDAELRALQNPNELQRDILTTRATQMLTNPISSEVGRVVEQTFGVDTFQVAPSLIDPYSQSTNRVNPSARVTIGKRISDRVYLTFSRSLSTSLNDQVLLLEYDASDRLSWILSRNEDESYAVEFRVRHSF